MGYRLAASPTRAIDRHVYSIYDDFAYYITGDLWTGAVAGTGTVTNEGSNGRTCMRLFSTAVDDAAVLATTNEIFKLRANKAMYCEGSILFADVDTDDGGIAFGWADALAATTIADAASLHAITATDALLIYKKMDELYWSFHTEINGTAVSSRSTLLAVSTAFQRLSIDVIPISATVLQARPSVDGVPLIDYLSGDAICHNITLGTATDLDFGVVVKGNDAADYITFVDDLYAEQVRS